MKAVVPAIFPIRTVSLELAVSGDAQPGEYLVAAIAYTEDGLRIGNRRLSWPEHSRRLAFPALPLPALNSDVVTVSMDLEVSTPATVLQLEIIDWRDHVAESGIVVHHCRWYAQADKPGLHACGTVDGKEWK